LLHPAIPGRVRDDCENTMGLCLLRLGHSRQYHFNQSDSYPAALHTKGWI